MDRHEAWERFEELEFVLVKDLKGKYVIYDRELATTSVAEQEIVRTSFATEKSAQLELMDDLAALNLGLLIRTQQDASATETTPLLSITHPPRGPNNEAAESSLSAIIWGCPCI